MLEWKQKHWSGKGNGDAFPRGNTTNFGWHFTSMANNHDCRPECRDVSLFGQRVCSHCWDQSEKAELLFFLEKCPVVCANLEILFLQWAGHDFDLDLSPSWQWINKKKGLPRKSSKVRTQTRSIHGAYCEIRGLCGHIEPSNLRGEIMCTEFICDPLCESLEKCSLSYKNRKISKQ